MSYMFAAATAVSVGSSLLGFGQAQSAAKKARKLRRQQIAAHDLESEENLRRMSLQRGGELSGARAASFASNLRMEGTQSNYIKAMSDQWSEDMSFQRLADDINRRAIRYGGSATISGIKSQGVASLLQGASSALSYFGAPGDSTTEGDT